MALEASPADSDKARKPLYGLGGRRNPIRELERIKGGFGLTPTMTSRSSQYGPKGRGGATGQGKYGCNSDGDENEGEGGDDLRGC